MPSLTAFFVTLSRSSSSSSAKALLEEPPALGVSSHVGRLSMEEGMIAGGCLFGVTTTASTSSIVTVSFAALE